MNWEFIFSGIQLLRHANRKKGQNFFKKSNSCLDFSYSNEQKERAGDCFTLLRTLASESQILNLNDKSSLDWKLKWEWVYLGKNFKIDLFSNNKAVWDMHCRSIR